MEEQRDNSGQSYGTIGHEESYILCKSQGIRRNNIAMCGTRVLCNRSILFIMGIRWQCVATHGTLCINTMHVSYVQ